MKCKVIRGCVIGGVKHKPGDWSNKHKPTLIEVDGRDQEVKHYVDMGVLKVVEDDPKPVRRKAVKKAEGDDA